MNTIEIIAKELNIEADKITYDKKNKLYIVQDVSLILNAFNWNFDIHFKQCNFTESIIYENKTFQYKIRFEACNFQKQVIFDDAHFQQDISFGGVVFEAGVDFLKTNFGKEVSFHESEFKDDTFFTSNIFNNKTNFVSTHFFKKISFEGSIFKQESLFLKCVANDFLSLFQCKFNILPNFSGAMIDKINLVNADFNLQKITYSNTIKNIQRYYILTNKEQTFTENTIIFRDSFRLFKNALIKENNLLDASQWHKLELYTKEIELDSKKPKIFSKDWIDKWVLRFYRHTSDHHTDLVRIIHWVIILIGYFSLTLFLGKYNCHLEIFFNNHSNNMPINLTNDFINTMVESKLIYLISFIAYIGICLKPIRLLIGYIGTFLIITINPKYIFGIASIFSNKYHFTYTENIIITIYSILMFLLLFSLQKTARKNSIVPH